VIVGKLDGKVAVITGGSTGMALAGAKLFVEEGAHVFIQARRQEALDDADELIGRNVTAVQATRPAGPASGSTDCATARSGSTS
jgi:NAD(P)-dependent dehydrogenase (short-subunit alcohol dehydrogenase family)